LLVPVAVVTVTVTGVAPPEGDPVRTGTLTWQVLWLGQTVDATASPKRTVITPFELNSPAPVSVTAWPVTPEDGDIEVRTGGPPARAGTGGAVVAGEGRVDGVDNGKEETGVVAGGLGRCAPPGWVLADPDPAAPGDREWPPPPPTAATAVAAPPPIRTAHPAATSASRGLNRR
jgi:hypothetical protein